MLAAQCKVHCLQNWGDFVHLAILLTRVQYPADTCALQFCKPQRSRSVLPCRCGSAEGLDAGRHCLQKWGFRRCEDICWIKCNATKQDRVQASVHQDSHSTLQHTKARPHAHLVSTNTCWSAAEQLAGSVQQPKLHSAWLLLLLLSEAAQPA